MKPDSDGRTETERWYDVHSDAYFDQTVGLLVAPLYEAFLAHLPLHCHILDAGCGSGRDSRAFAKRGYRVTAIDSSSALVENARQYTGLPVQVLRFEDIAWEAAFDGIWACASLLHTPRAALPQIMTRLIRALRPGGVWYMSFKFGTGDRLEDGRAFTDFTPTTLRTALAEFKALKIIDLWQTTSTPPLTAESGQQKQQNERRPKRQEWTNALVQRVHSSL